jgi:hypothetical protein
MTYYSKTEVGILFLKIVNVNQVSYFLVPVFFKLHAKATVFTTLVFLNLPPSGFL